MSEKPGETMDVQEYLDSKNPSELTHVEAVARIRLAWIDLKEEVWASFPTILQRMLPKPDFEKQRGVIHDLINETDNIYYQDFGPKIIFKLPWIQEGEE